MTVKRALFYLLVLLTALYCMGPFLWQVITSVKPAAQLTSLPPLFPSKVETAHYIAVFEGHPFLRIIANSAVVASCTTLLSLAIGSLAAFALAKFGLRRKGLILAVVLSVSMFPPIATVSPLYIIIRAVGLRDTLAALIMTYTTFTLPLSIWVLTNFFKNVPDELYLASSVDGCTPFQTFYKIFLPVSAPGLFATAILVFIFSWNEFLFALTFTSTVASRTIPAGIALFPGIHEIPWGEIAAASVVVTVPLVILVFAFQRRIVEGLTAGSVRG
jgi:multiple sugar transport system permease protein